MTTRGLCFGCGQAGHFLISFQKREQGDEQASSGARLSRMNALDREGVVDRRRDKYRPVSGTGLLYEAMGNRKLYQGLQTASLEDDFSRVNGAYLWQTRKLKIVEVIGG